MSRRSVAAVLVFAVLALACVVVALDMVHEDPEEVPTLLVSDDVLVYGDIADASEVMIQDTGDGLSFELLDVPDGTVSFLWSFTDRTGMDHRWTTSEPSVTVSKTDLTPGGYGVAIGTSRSAGGTYSAAATGGMSLYGTITDDYEWVYHGRTYSATVSYDYRDCERLLLDTDYGSQIIRRIFTESDTQGTNYQSVMLSASSEEAETMLQTWLKDFGATKAEIDQIKTLSEGYEVAAILGQVKSMVEDTIHAKGIPTLIYNGKKHNGLYEP